MPLPSIGLQLFSVRGECHNLPATLQRIGQLGYAGIEPWGYDGDALAWRGHSATELRRLLDEHGLQCCGIHCSTASLQGDRLKTSLEFSQILGHRFLVIAMDKTRMSTSTGIAELAHILDEAAAYLAPHGRACGYHAHGFDFQSVDGAIAWDTLFSRTRPEVIMQLDIGNCASGGGDPLATLARFPDRARTLHLKEIGSKAGQALGEGTTDWAHVFAQIGRHQKRLEWLVIEEGGPDGVGFDVPSRSLQFLRSLVAQGVVQPAPLD
jgi:sugar phosphate isomerase/epimerase